MQIQSKVAIKVVDDSTVKGKNEINQQLDQEINFLHYFPGEEEVWDVRKTVHHFSLCQHK